MSLERIQTILQKVYKIPNPPLNLFIIYIFKIARPTNIYKKDSFYGHLDIKKYLLLYIQYNKKIKIKVFLNGTSAKIKLQQRATYLLTRMTLNIYSIDNSRDHVYSTRDHDYFRELIAKLYFPIVKNLSQYITLKEKIEVCHSQPVT